MALEGGLFKAKVFHKRLRPIVNAFTYRVYYYCLPLSRLAAAHNAVSSLDGFNLFSFHRADHGALDGSDLEQWARAQLARFDVTAADGEIVLLSHPRIVGHVFNPVSFWFCLDKAGALRAVIAEVNNTFKERHSYLIFHPDQRAITAGDQMTTDKRFHVSPFMHVEGIYHFRFNYSEKQIAVWIDYETKDGMMLNTSLAGKRTVLDSQSALMAFVTIPFVTLKTVALIHWQAIKLWYKGVKYVPKPDLPDEEITR